MAQPLLQDSRGYRRLDLINLWANVSLTLGVRFGALDYKQVTAVSVFRDRLSFGSD